MDGMAPRPALRPLLLPALLASALASCSRSCARTAPADAGPPPAGARSARDLAVSENGLSEARVVIATERGEIAYRFYPEAAPGTVTRMMELIGRGFYDGLVFHRVVPDFVVQTGDPFSQDGNGGSGRALKAEFNDIQHTRGTVAMARARDPDSADSQFYIALSTLPHLDGRYTVFGQVVGGFDVLDRIRKGDKILSVTIDRD